jgi:hypothetical protein
MERERLVVYKATAEERNRLRDAYDIAHGHLLVKYYQARGQYVDELTECQQNAINLIRIMDIGDWIEGIGGKMGWARRVRGAYGNEGVVDDVVYILDC